MGVEGRGIGCCLASGGAILGDGAAEVDALDPEVLVSILRSGGADNRVEGGVTDADPGRLGLLKEGDGVSVVEEDDS